LHALAEVGPQCPIELTVLGDGDETTTWQDLAQRLRIQSRTRWTGELPQAEAVALVAQADVFVFTSLQEGTPNVVLEALSLGLPVICHDACGMGAVVDETCGLKVPLRNPACSIKGFVGAIRHLASHPVEVARLSAGALRRAAELTWDIKARLIAETYDRTLSECSKMR
jgi:glycosyltransferase involved in cell wall biosynthesis